MAIVLDATFHDEVCQWLSIGVWIFLGTPVSSTNKTDHHGIIEILLKVAFKHYNPNPKFLRLEMIYCRLENEEMVVIKIMKKQK